MKINRHLEELQRKHYELDRRVHEEENRPLPDPTTLHDLKAKKLFLKDELAQYWHEDWSELNDIS